jgi:hypothetical protein
MGGRIMRFANFIKESVNRKRNKVRFNLSRGQNYMKWKIEFSDGSIEYLEPSEYQLEMINCTLKNNKNTSMKIFGGENKSVCAWILCDEVNIKKSGSMDIKSNYRPIKYNPRVNPFWVLDGKDIDGKSFDTIKSVGKQLFVYEDKK